MSENDLLVWWKAAQDHIYTAVIRVTESFLRPHSMNLCNVFLRAKLTALSRMWPKSQQVLQIKQANTLFVCALQTDT